MLYKLLLSKLELMSLFGSDFFFRLNSLKMYFLVLHLKPNSMSFVEIILRMPMIPLVIATI